jgi:hypothetical protein
MKKVLLCLLIFVAVNARAQTSVVTNPNVSTSAATKSAANAESPTPTATPTPTSNATPEAKPPETKNGAVSAASTSLKGRPALPPEKSAPVRLPRFEAPPVIDGKLDDAAWKQAAVFKDFYQIQPGDNIAPSQKTEVLMGYDARNLYIAFHAYDDPSKVRSTVSKRDAIFDDDYVGIFLDTFNDQRKAYELLFNPLGVQADAIYTEKTNGDQEDFTVDVVMESKGEITGDGYTVEVKIPFKSLRFETGAGKLWGIHLLRRIKRANNELDSWMPVSRDISGTLNQEGHIKGLENIAAEHTLELIPSITVSETGKRIRAVLPSFYSANPNFFDAGRFLNKPIGADIGLTGKYTITPNIILDFTINPDFAQVEADQTVVTANQRFPIFFPEKRPFFLEGKDIFETPIQAVNTRAIISPDVAAKLTGKRGRNTFGILLAVDSGPGSFGDEELDDIRDYARTDPSPSNYLSSVGRVLDKKAYIGIIRLKRDIGAKDSNIGFLATSYDFGDEPASGTIAYTSFETGVRHNRLAGFDGRLRINEKTIFTFQTLGTMSRRYFYDPVLDASVYRAGNGFAYSADLDYTSRHFGYFMTARGRTRDYRADVGFTRRTNNNGVGAFFRFSSDPKPKAFLIQKSLRLQNSINFDWQGRSQNRENSFQLNLNFKHQTNAGLGAGNGYERLIEEEFGAKRLPATLTTPARAGAFAGASSERSSPYNFFFGFVETTLSKKYSFNIFANYQRGTFDYDFGAPPHFPRVSPAALIDPNAPLDPGAGNQLDIQASVVYRPTDNLRFSLDYTKSRLRRNDTGLLAFDDNIFSARASYQFTRFVFARARVDYDTLSASIKSQLLFGYTPNPGTAFYVGYDDDLNYRGYNYFNPNLAFFEPGFRRNSRTFFIKASYLIRRNIGGRAK